MEQFKNAQRISESIGYEKKRQTPDYEWMEAKHRKKMFLKALEIHARDLDKMYEKVWGRKPWSE